MVSKVKGREHPKDPMGFCSPWIKYILSDIGFIQAPDCGLHPGEEAASASCSGAPVQGCDSGKLQGAGLTR